MFNPIPELLYLSFFAPFFLRIALGLVLFLTSFHQLVDRREEITKRFVDVWPKNGVEILWTASVIEIVVGLAFVAGFYTQIAAIVGALFSFTVIFYKKYRQATTRDIVFYILMFAISLSLMVTGAGVFAFDMPL
jgi:uncharacterized membrane protein YphA (DoxX/SURF4 family)